MEKQGQPTTHIHVSTATYQILLQGGDIHPNPGPSSDNGRQHKDEQTSYKPNRICYDATFLRKLDPPPHITRHQRLANDVWKNIVSLGIAKKYKTRRSKKKEDQNKSLPVTNDDSLLQRLAMVEIETNPPLS